MTPIPSACPSAIRRQFISRTRKSSRPPSKPPRSASGHGTSHPIASPGRAIWKTSIVCRAAVSTARFAFVQNDVHPDDRAQVLAAIRGRAPHRHDRAACSTGCRRVRTAKNTGSSPLPRVVVEDGKPVRHARDLQRRHRARQAAPRTAHPRKPAGGGGAARRARADRNRPAETFRRYGGDHRGNPRR